MILHTYTIIHVLICLVATFSGIVVVFGVLNAEHLDGWQTETPFNLTHFVIGYNRL